MSHSDAFALKNSGLNEFLFAVVGTEANGSPLTILSVLARLGKDPWVEAARWAKLPRASIIDRLANSISQMPLPPQALVEARLTAARLILLLPSPAQSVRETESTAKNRIPSWVPIAVFFAILACGITYQIVAPAAPATPLVQQAKQHPQAAKN